MASVECCVCSDALSHDHNGVRCASDPPHHLCGDCSISFCASKLNELSADAFPPACSMCSDLVTLASFDAHLNAEQRPRFLQVSLTQHSLEKSKVWTLLPVDSAISKIERELGLLHIGGALAAQAFRIRIYVEK